MSYCVECGVKLEQSLKHCPLCQTPVVNPNELMKVSNANNNEPFAKEKGEVEPIKKHDIGLWLTLVFGSTAIACGLLNFLVFNHNYWSIPVIGACIIIWLFFCPRMFLPQIPVYLNLLATAISIIFYEFAITFMTKNNHCFFEIALPTTLVVIVLISISTFFYKVVS